MGKEFYVDSVFDYFVLHHDSGLVRFGIKGVKLAIRKH